MLSVSVRVSPACSAWSVIGVRAPRTRGAGSSPGTGILRIGGRDGPAGGGAGCRSRARPFVVHREPRSREVARFMEAPKQIKPKGLADYLEVMTKAAFQAGISWKVIEAKWDGFRDAFEGFDPVKVASFEAPDVDRLAQDTRIVRNRAKIEATVHNARTMLELDAEYRGFRKYLRSFGDFDALVKDMKKRFKFLGDMGCYYMLWVVGEQVPSHEDWMKTRQPAPSRARR